MMENTNTENDSSLRNPELILISLKNIVKEIAAGISSTDFQEIMTTLSNKPSVVKSLYELQTNDIINDNLQIIDNMYKETDIDTKYNEITQLLNNSAIDKNSEAWRPVTGDCEMQLAPYRKKYLIEKKYQLEKLFQDEKSTRLLLKKSLDRKRARVESLLNDMNTTKTMLCRYSENYIS